MVKGSGIRWQEERGNELGRIVELEVKKFWTHRFSLSKGPSFEGFWVWAHLPSSHAAVLGDWSYQGPPSLHCPHPTPITSPDFSVFLTSTTLATWGTSLFLKYSRNVSCLGSWHFLFFVLVLPCRQSSVCLLTLGIYSMQ